MHKITISEIRGEVNTHLEGTVVGLRATIEPPVDFDPDAIENFVQKGDVDGTNRVPSLTDGAELLGSNKDNTVIYCDLRQSGEDIAETGALLGQRVAGFLTLMGLESEVVPLPDAQ